MNQKWIALLLALILALSVCGCAADKPQTETAETTAAVETRTAAGQSTVTDEELTQTAQWLMEQIPQPTYGSVGGEWAVFGLARSGVAVPKEYFEVYGENVAAYTAEHGGVLHAKKYTEYSRVILAWTALGKDATDVGGFNLLVPLADFDQTVFQGINGPIFALLALDSGAYDIPENTAGTTQATRDGYVDYILNAELPGGGWSFAGGDAETDITAMAGCGGRGGAGTDCSVSAAGRKRRLCSLRFGEQRVHRAGDRGADGAGCQPDRLPVRQEREHAGKQAVGIPDGEWRVPAHSRWGRRRDGDGTGLLRSRGREPG